MKIVTDCAADLSAEELKELDIEQAPLYIQFPDGEVSSADITADSQKTISRYRQWSHIDCADGNRVRAWLWRG